MLVQGIVLQVRAVQCKGGGYQAGYLDLESSRPST